MRLALILLILPAAALAQQSGWGNVGDAQEEVFTWAKWWTEPMFSGFWMAWTRATLAFFIFIFGCIGIMALLELRWPGGAERLGILGLTTTRGDRLFISLLGSAYIFLAWLGLVGPQMWVPLGLAVAWAAFAFWKI
jgi:predicted small integral membrane protein